MLGVDDLLEPRLEQIARYRRLMLLRPHRSLRCSHRITPADSRKSSKRNCKLSGAQIPKPCDLKTTRRFKIRFLVNGLSVVHGQLTNDYPFTPLANVGRRYTPQQCMSIFVRDGFIDRYSGQRLVFPGTLRLLSMLFPLEFPFHSNWKTDACHFAFYELYPTIDHLVPVSRSGVDSDDNRLSTSMLRNAAKANFTIEELEWTTSSCGRDASVGRAHRMVPAAEASA